MTDLGLRALPAPQNYKFPAQVVIIANTQLWLTPVAVVTEVRGSTFGLKRRRGVGTPTGCRGNFLVLNNKEVKNELSLPIFLN